MLFTGKNLFSARLKQAKLLLRLRTFCRSHKNFCCALQTEKIFMIFLGIISEKYIFFSKDSESRWNVLDLLRHATVLEFRSRNWNCWKRKQQLIALFGLENNFQQKSIRYFLISIIHLNSTESNLRVSKLYFHQVLQWNRNISF